MSKFRIITFGTMHESDSGDTIFDDISFNSLNELNDFELWCVLCSAYLVGETATFIDQEYKEVEYDLRSIEDGLVEIRAYNNEIDEGKLKDFIDLVGGIDHGHMTRMEYDVEINIMMEGTVEELREFCIENKNVWFDE